VLRQKKKEKKEKEKQKKSCHFSTAGFLI